MLVQNGFLLLLQGVSFVCLNAGSPWPLSFSRRQCLGLPMLPDLHVNPSSSDALHRSRTTNQDSGTTILSDCVWMQHHSTTKKWYKTAVIWHGGSAYVVCDSVGTTFVCGHCFLHLNIWPAIIHSAIILTQHNFGKSLSRFEYASPQEELHHHSCPSQKENSPRAAIFTSQSIPIQEISNLGHRDLAVGLIKCGNKETAIISAYMDIKANPITEQLQTAIDYCKSRG